MAQTSMLTARQLSLLRWIADGCPPGVVAGSSHRISARALHNRDLVRISGHGATWRARITKAGREYLNEAEGENPPIVRQANGSVTQQLVDDVIAAGGALRVPRQRWDEPGAVDYVTRARLAERYRKVPPGKRLLVASAGQELEISLVDAPDATVVELVEIKIPGRARRQHAVARVFRERRPRHEVSRAQLGRASHLVQVIAIEAERRGWMVSAPAGTETHNGYVHWTGTKHGHIAITACGFGFWIRVREEGVATRGQWELDVERCRDVRHDLWPYTGRELPSGPYDARASGRFKLELFAETHQLSRGRQSRWADRRRWTVEDRLPHLFREIEERVADARRAAEEKRTAQRLAAEAAQRQAEDRERQWHLLMAEARKQLVATDRASRLRAELDAWQEAALIRRYCKAVERRHPGAAGSDWIAWARAYAERLDPLRQPPAMPAPPEPTPESLQRHLPPGWSAQGADHPQLHPSGSRTDPRVGRTAS